MTTPTSTTRDSTCPICLDEDTQKPRSRLPCGHYIHHQCAWKGANSGTFDLMRKCSLCFAEIPVNSIPPVPPIPLRTKILEVYTDGYRNAPEISNLFVVAGLIAGMGAMGREIGCNSIVFGYSATYSYVFRNVDIVNRIGVVLYVALLSGLTAASGASLAVEKVYGAVPFATTAVGVVTLGSVIGAGIDSFINNTDRYMTKAGFIAGIASCVVGGCVAISNVSGTVNNVALIVAGIAIPVINHYGITRAFSERLGSLRPVRIIIGSICAFGSAIFQTRRRR